MGGSLWSKQSKQSSKQSSEQSPPPPPMLTNIPWRKIALSGHMLEKKVVEEIKEIKHKHKLGILLTGPVGAGKSSFTNSCLSIGVGRKKVLADPGRSETSYTLNYMCYSDNKLLEHFRLYDCVGVEPGDGNGLSHYDIPYLLNGHVKKGYTFKSNTVFDQSSDYYNPEPTFEDKILCVVFVVDAVTMYAGYAKEYIQKIKILQDKIKTANVARVLVLTKADRLCTEVKKDPSNIFKSVKVERAVKIASEVFGIELASIHPVVNYEDQYELTTEQNIPILLALRQILQYASDRAEFFLGL